ncbi:MAG: hypothetical protein HUJ51_03885 [Eggerthellaceae bacterium]|nr:hypothetical protein [Eggerthellaceae bacterium]
MSVMAEQIAAEEKGDQEQHKIDQSTKTINSWQKTIDKCLRSSYKKCCAVFYVILCFSVSSLGGI